MLPAKRKGQDPVHGYLDVRQQGRGSDLDTVALRSSAQKVLSFLLDQHEPVTRPEVALACQLSRPTVFAAMKRLEDLQLVCEVGQRSGVPGRSASLYELRTEAALVAGIDIGGSNLRVALADGRGRLLAETRQATSATGGPGVVKQVVDLVKSLGKGTASARAPLTVAGVSVPGVVAADASTVHYAWNIGQPEPYDFRTPLMAGLHAHRRPGQQREPRRPGRAMAGCRSATANLRGDRGRNRCGRRHRSRGPAVARSPRRRWRGGVPAVEPRLSAPTCRIPRRSRRPDAPAHGTGPTGLARRRRANQRGGAVRAGSRW